MENTSRLPIKHDGLRCFKAATDEDRSKELGLDEAAFEHWTYVAVAHGLSSVGVDYEPSESVQSLDVFHAVPLKAAATSREDWMENHLLHWRSFSKTEPVLHEVNGEDYTMLGPDHVAEFAQSLILAMRQREVKKNVEKYRRTVVCTSEGRI